MRIFIFLGCALLAGCATTATTHHAPNEKVVYKDTNGDGQTDLEYHSFPGTTELEWEYIDQNYDGYYDVKIVHGFVKGVTPVTKKVPNVPPTQN